MTRSLIVVAALSAACGSPASSVTSPSGVPAGTLEAKAEHPFSLYVYEPSVQRIEGATVVITTSVDTLSDVTNKRGRVVFRIPASDTEVLVAVTAEGYCPLTTTVPVDSANGSHYLALTPC